MGSRTVKNFQTSGTDERKRHPVTNHWQKNKRGNKKLVILILNLGARRE